MWSIIGAIIKLIVLFFTSALEKNKEKRVEKKKALKEVTDGIKKKDPSKITAGFDHINRL